MAKTHKMRTYKTGAVRDNNDDKLQYHGFISPIALKSFAEYMHKHRKQANGELRSPDNWKKGIPVEDYHESLIRHVMDYWRHHDLKNDNELNDLLNAIFFNVQGLLHERNKREG